MTTDTHSYAHYWRGGRGRLRAAAAFALVLLAPLAAPLHAAPQAAEALETPPPVGTPRGFDLPAQHILTLDNGLRVTLVQYGIVPKATISARIRTGNVNETADQVWLADLTVDLMSEGTTSRSAQQIAAEAATMGGEVNLNVGSETTNAGLDVLAEMAPRGVRLIADVLRNPAFPASEVDRLKNDMIRNVTIALSQPQPIADQRLAALIYGDHPYGRLFPTPEQIGSYSLEDVRAFYQANFGARRTHLYVVGKFDEAAVEAAIRQSFGDWRRGPEVFTNPPTLHSERKVHLIDRPDAAQSTLRISIPTVDPSHPDFTALQVMNSLLGGSINSRITRNIREDKGYTYSPGSGFETRYGSGLWTQRADITTNVTGAAIQEILQEIERLRSEAPGEAELRGIQNYMAGLFVLQNSSPGGIIAQLARIELHDLPADYLENRVNDIYAVTPEQVRRVAEQYLRPEEMTFVIAGDRATILDQVREFGEVVD